MALANQIRIMFWGSSFALLQSCVTLNQQTYLQPLAESNVPQPIGAMPELPDYRIQNYDILSITIKTSNPEIDALYNKQSNANPMIGLGPMPLYFMGYHVLPNGSVEIPGVGEVYVAGMTVFEAREAIQKALEPLFIRQDAYQVSVVLAGIRYTVIGECNRPGIHYLYLDRGTLIDAIAEAGDLTLLADRKHIQVLRQTQGTWQEFQVDLTAQSSISSSSIYLQPNDVIMVRPLPQKSWGFGQTGLSSFTTIVSVLSSSLAVFFALSL